MTCRVVKFADDRNILQSVKNNTGLQWAPKWFLHAKGIGIKMEGIIPWEQIKVIHTDKNIPEYWSKTMSSELAVSKIVMMNNSIKIPKQGALTAQKEKSTLGIIRNNTESRDVNIIIPLYK